MNDEKRKAAARQAYESYTSMRHLRSTSERTAILEAVLDRREAFTAAALGSDLTGRGFRVSRATLYNSLGLLEAAGIVSSRPTVSGGRSALLYELTDAGGVAFVLECCECGRRRTARDSALARSLLAKRFRSFSVTGIDVCVRGICGKCRSALRRKV